MTAADAYTDAGPLQYGACARAYRGEIDSGDRHLVATFPTGALIAVVDGLGHGGEAAMAARAAVDCLTQFRSETASVLMQRCHAALRKTRGAVLSLASIAADCNRLTWVGVGNVEAALFRADPSARPQRKMLSCRGGVLGYNLPPLRCETLSIASADTLVIVTDGVAGRCFVDSPIGKCPQHAAQQIIDLHDKQTDDALVVVARYVGIGPP